MTSHLQQQAGAGPNWVPQLQPPRTEVADSGPNQVP